MAISYTRVNNPQDGLDKLRIDIYPNETASAPDVGYLAMYNPTGFSQEFKNVYDKAKVSGNQEVNVFKHIEAPTLNIELLLDATGASISKPSKASFAGEGTVHDLTEMVRGHNTFDAICIFLDDLNSVKGEDHKPGFVEVSWGHFIFRGILESAKVSHTLFKANGVPIRSKVNCTFKSQKSLEEQQAETKKNSPDLTRFKMVKAEDTLPLIAFDVYEDTSFYLELARINKLNNFRSLRNGIKLRLPPVKK